MESIKLSQYVFKAMLANSRKELERICNFINYPKQSKWYKKLNVSNILNQRMIKSKWRKILVEITGIQQLRRCLGEKFMDNFVKNIINEIKHKKYSRNT